MTWWPCHSRLNLKWSHEKWREVLSFPTPPSIIYHTFAHKYRYSQLHHNLHLVSISQVYRQPKCPISRKYGLASVLCLASVPFSTHGSRNSLQQMPALLNFGDGSPYGVQTPVARRRSKRSAQVPSLKCRNKYKLTALRGQLPLT